MIETCEQQLGLLNEIKSETFQPLDEDFISYDFLNLPNNIQNLNSTSNESLLIGGDINLNPASNVSALSKSSLQGDPLLTPLSDPLSPCSNIGPFSPSSNYSLSSPLSNVLSPNANLLSPNSNISVPNSKSSHSWTHVPSTSVLLTPPPSANSSLNTSQNTGVVNGNMNSNKYTLVQSMPASEQYGILYPQDKKQVQIQAHDKVSEVLLVSIDVCNELFYHQRAVSRIFARNLTPVNRRKGLKATKIRIYFSEEYLYPIKNKIVN